MILTHNLCLRGRGGQLIALDEYCSLESDLSKNYIILSRGKNLLSTMLRVFFLSVKKAILFLVLNQ